MSHLPRPDLCQLIAQRQRVLRGRDLTRWERLRDRLPNFDGFEVVWWAAMLLNAIGLIVLLVLAR